MTYTKNKHHEPSKTAKKHFFLAAILRHRVSGVSGRRKEETKAQQIWHIPHVAFLKNRELLNGYIPGEPLGKDKPNTKTELVVSS